MKKNMLNLCFMCAVMMCVTFASSAVEIKANTSALVDKPMESGINVSIKGQYLDFSGDEPPVIDDGRTLVPLRSIFEALDVEVSWDDNTKTVTATSRDNVVIKMTIDETEYTVNGENKVLDVPAKIINSRTFVPVRAVSESLGCIVEWDDERQMVYVIPENSAKIQIDGDLTTFGINRDVKTNTSDYEVRAAVTDNFIYKQSGNTILISAGDDKKLKIDTYDSEFNRVSEKILDFELPLFGGFYTDGIKNYILFGQENKTETNNAEVFRLVKYDLNFNKLSSVSINGATSMTVTPFRSGGVSMASNENELVVHASKLRYASSDGLNHQSQITFVINTDTMKLTNKVGEYQTNHVSHSFNQYVKYDGDDHVLVDHGDAYPRSVVIHKGDGSSYKEVDLLDIPGTIGSNATGVSVGGLEVSSSNYLVPINKIDFNSNSSSQRDVVMLTCNKGLSGVSSVTLQKYVGTDKTSTTPKIISAGTDKYIVMWEELATSKQKLGVKYVVVDGTGKATSAVKSIENTDGLSDVLPMYDAAAKTLTWFVNDNVYELKVTV